MTLGELIVALGDADPNYVAPIGFGKPHSYRGNYADVAFNPEKNVTVAFMLEQTRSALNSRFTGYKGGEFMMHDYVECHISRPDQYDGDRIGPVLLAYLTGRHSSIISKNYLEEVDESRYKYGF